MSTLFISHSSRDNELAKELGRRLARQNHHSVFLDLDPEQGIVAGQSWEQTLYRKLRACRAVIALVTDHYLESQWCFAEIALARMEGKHIIALQVNPLGEGAKMPAILSERQFIDLRRNGEEGYRRLWNGLREQDLLGAMGEWDPKKAPYLGLSAYQEEHAPVFFGREDESRSGLELLSRGAPGLIMVLGASGSGKSSLVRAGMLPRLRREEGRWLPVDPFRPGGDPYGELAESLVQTWRRYAPDDAARVGSAGDIRARLASWTPPSMTPDLAARQNESGESSPNANADPRLARLIRHIEEFRNDPPAPLQDRVLDFLDWGLDDLRRITSESARLASATIAQGAGTTPLTDIARDLQRASGQRNARVLLIVDQFEELLGRDGSDDETNRFLALLRATLEGEHGQLMVLGTMRSDFLGMFQRNAALRGIDFESLSLGPMRLDGMRRVIEEPARLGALELEPGLADRLLADTETPDALPLLSFTLSVLWRDYRQDGKLDVREYEQLGGLSGAIAGESQALLASAKKEGMEDALRIAFLRMARLTEEGGYARQPVAWDAAELRPVHAVLERFIARRLLVTRDEGGARMVEVAHEALFRSWAPLKTWLDNNRTELQLRHQIRRDARTWQESDRARENLWRGGRLQQAKELLRNGQLAPQEREFVRKGLRLLMVQRLAVVAVTLCVVSVLGVLYLQARIDRANAEQARQSAESQYLAISAQSSLRSQPSGKDFSFDSETLVDLRSPFDQASKAWALERSPFTRSALIEVVSRFVSDYEYAGLNEYSAPATLTPGFENIAWRPGSHGFVTSVDRRLDLWTLAPGGGLKVTRDGPAIALDHWASGIAWSPDGERMASWTGSGASIIGLKGAAPSVTQLTEDGVWNATWSPRSDRLAIATYGAGASVWSADGTFLRQLESAEEDPRAVAWSPDGEHLLTALFDGTLRVWEAGDRPPGQFREAASFPTDGSGDHVAWSPDSQRFATLGGTTATIWKVDGERAAVLEHAPLIPSQLAWRPRGQWPKRLVTRAYAPGTSYDHPLEIRLWSSDGTLLKKISDGHAADITGVAWSPDGSRFMSWSRDKTVRIWSADGEGLAILGGHGASVNAAAWSADGRLVVTATGQEPKLQVWPLDMEEVLALGEHWMQRIESPEWKAIQEVERMCPWIFVRQRGQWSRRVEIIQNLRGKNREETQIVSLGRVTPEMDGEITLQIREEKHEISYVDRIQLRFEGGTRTIPVSTASAGSRPLLQVDQDYLVLRNGDAIEVVFRDEEFQAGKGRDLEIIATGYYDVVRGVDR